MAILVRPACGGCGSYDTASRGGWIRCKSCKSLVGQDAVSYVDSEAYAAHVKRAMEPGYAERWTDYQTLVDQARALAERSEFKASFDVYRVAQRWLIDVMPSTFPPEVLEDAAYRERVVAHGAFMALAQVADARVAELVQEQATLTVKDYRNPLPAIQALSANITKQVERTAALSFGPVRCPPDPDDIVPSARARVYRSVLVSAYLGSCEQNVRADVLRWLWGADAVKAPRLSGELDMRDEGSMFLDATCPRCELLFLATRGASDLTCPGCLRRYPMTEAWFKRQPVICDCTRCGAPVSFDSESLRATCSFCSSPVVRVAADDARRVRSHQDLLAKAFAISGVEAMPDPLPEEGTGGLAVTTESREGLAVSGLARIASWYYRFVSAARFLRLVRGSFPGASKPALAAAFEAIEARLTEESASSEAQTLVEQARALSAPARSRPAVP